MEYCILRRQEAAAKWGLKDEIVLVGAGTPVSIPGRADQLYRFRPHSEYFYLTDRERPGGVLAFDPQDGWTDFVPTVTAEEALWLGSVVEEGVPMSGFADWLGARSGRRIACLGSPIPEIPCDPGLTTQARQVLTQIRWRKDELELARMREAARATAAGFAVIPPLVKPGTTERQLQIEIEAEFFRNGAEATAYETIVGGGPNSAVLHFQPSSRPFGSGELVLIDAGAEYQAYACDVTRTYPVSGRFNAQQRDIYDTVLAAQQRSIQACRAGTEYKDVHLTATRVVVDGLLAFGLLRGTPDSLIEQGAHALFFPHGIGHMVGLGVRDAGGYSPGRLPNDRPGLRYLRIDLPLKAGYAVTIEPGIYFIPSMLRNQEHRRTYRDAVDWNLADSMIGFGGIRIEDNVLIAENGCEILTSSIPKLF